MIYIYISFKISFSLHIHKIRLGILRPSICFQTDKFIICLLKFISVWLKCNRSRLGKNFSFSKKVVLTFNRVIKFDLECEITKKSNKHNPDPLVWNGHHSFVGCLHMCTKGHKTTRKLSEHYDFLWGILIIFCSVWVWNFKSILCRWDIYFELPESLF